MLQQIQGFRLSPQQRHIWSLQQQSAAYCAQCAILVEGNLSAALLRDAVEQICNRHEALRTTYQTAHGMTTPVQIINQCRPGWRNVSLTLAEGEQAELEALLKEESSRRFDFEQGPILHALLVRASTTRHFLILTLPSICADVVSLKNMVSEISRCYGVSAGSEEALEEVLQYAQFSEWQNALFEDEADEAGKQFRKNESGRESVAPALPFEKQPAQELAFEIATYETEIDFDLMVKAYAAASNYDTTPAVFLLACWHALLWRLTGQQEITIGNLFDGRKYDELSAIVGLLAKRLPISARFQDDLRFCDLLTSLDQSTKYAYDWQESFNPEEATDNPIGFCFAEQALPRSTGRVTFSVYKQQVCIDRFKLNLFCIQKSDSLAAQFQYDSGLFQADDIKRLAAEFCALLENAADNHALAIDELSILSRDEKQHLLCEFNRTKTDYPAEACIQELFEQQVERTPHNIAARFHQQQLTYAELNARANQLAHHLRRVGVGPESLVGICVERSLDMLAGLLGVLKSGAAYVPIDSEYPDERLAYILKDTGAKMILTEQRYVEKFTGYPATVICLDQSAEAFKQESRENPLNEGSAENLAYVIYTSGSTGKPKGVMIRHRGLVNYLSWCVNAYRVSEGRGSLVHSPIGFDLTITSLFSPLLVGQCAVLIPEDEGVEGLSAALQSGEAYGLVKITPAHLEALRHMLNTNLNSTGAIPRAGCLVIGGEALLAEHLSFWRDSAGRTRLINEYGPTETVVGCCVYEAAAETSLKGAVPIGRPIANTQLYLLNSHLEPVPSGVAGELYIAGDGLARGYLNRPDLTAERFIPNPFSDEPGQRLYKSGDLARFLSDDNIEFLGRSDYQVKVRGFRIELGEIEAVLREYPAVKEAVVIVREDEPGEKRLVAYVVGERTASREIRDYLRSRLPDYMMPSAFVMLDSFPLTVNGKVDRGALPAPDSIRPDLEENFAAPRTPVEKILAEVWAEALRVERVGLHDNFFELGGDSILSIQIVARSSRRGLKLTPKQVFQCRTVAELAKVVDIAAPSEAEQETVVGETPLTPIERWFFERQSANPNHFNQSVLLEARQPLEATRIRRAISRLIEHHDALRLRVAKDDEGRLLQVCGAVEGDAPFTVIDISALADEQHKAAIEAAATQAHMSLSLTDGPILRVAQFEVGEQKPQRLLIVIHHLATDGVSWRILLEDLQECYEQAGRGQQIKLPAKTTSYKHWAERLVEHAKTDALKREGQYWLAELDAGELGAGASPLPIDYPEGKNAVGSGRTVHTSLDQKQTRALLQEVPAAYHTQINDVLLTALAQAVEQLTGARRLLIEMEGHGREEIFEDVDLSRTVGWFTSIYPVTLGLGDSSDAGDALKRIKEHLRQVPNRGIGYGLLRYLGSGEITERLRGAARPAISFNYLGQFDQVAGQMALFTRAQESSGVSQSLNDERAYLLDVNASVSGGRLQINWGYSEDLFRRETIERLAEAYIAALDSLIAHCRSVEAVRHTPSDFPLVSLTQQELDRITESNLHIQEIYPLSPMQQGLLFHTIYAPNSGVYFGQLTCAFEGDLDVSIFRRAWQEAIDRHAILRTSFLYEHLSEPLQVVHSSAELPLTIEDWRGLGAVEQERELESYLKADRTRGFDLSVPPLIRLALFRVSESAYRLVWSHHHLLLDGWSTPLLIKEILASYGARYKGREIEQKSVRPYRDYIAWLGEQDVSKAEAFWRDKLKGFTAPTPLGVDRPTALKKEQGGYDDRLILLSAETTGALQALARQHQVTLNTVVQGAWALLLNRYSGEDDLIFGAIVSGRPPELAGIEAMIGLFVNTMPVRVRIDGEASLSAWLKQIQEEQSELMQYEYSSLAQVQSWSEAPRGVPLFESLLAFDNYPVDYAITSHHGEHGFGFKIRDVQTAPQTNYPLTVVVTPGERLLVRIYFDAGWFDGETIDRMLGHVGRLLEGFIADPEQRISELPVLTEPERRELLTTWNDTRADYQRDKCFHHLFEQQVESNPDAPALIFEKGRMSYSELNRRANQLARHLRMLGLKPDNCAAVCIERREEMIVALLAIMKAGGAYVPIDPALPVKRIEFMLKDCQPTVILTLKQIRDKLPKNCANVICLDSDWEIISEQSDRNLTIDVSPDNLVYVIYTSGSTGLPKGVMISHRGLSNYLTWCSEAYAVESGDGSPVLSSIGFDLTVTSLFPPLMTGRSLELIKEDEVIEGLAKALRAGSQYSLIKITPAHLEALSQVLSTWDGQIRANAFVIGGEALTAEQLAFWRERGPATRLINEYGPTETVVGCCVYEVPKDASDSGAVSIGRPIANTRIYLLNDQLQPVPIGVAGEIYIAGEGVARGYLNRPELTAERFIPDTFSGEAGTRLYKTGDLARYLPDGNIYYLGRADSQVKFHGFRLELDEIRAALNQHSQIRESVAVISKDRNGNSLLVAYYVSRRELDVSELRAFLSEALVQQTIPNVFVHLRKLPLTLNGKVNYQSLPPIDDSKHAVERNVVAPRTQIEEMLAGIWSRVLGKEQVGAQDNFFELGGHSLLATQVISRVREAFKIDLPLRTLFEKPTIAGLGESIEALLKSGQGITTPPMTRASRESALPLSFAQQRLWILDQLEPGSSFYNTPIAVRLTGQLNVAAFEQTMSEIIRRHEILRTVIPVIDGEPVQVIAPAQTIKLPVIDISHLSESERESQARQLASEEAARPFDLAKGPLLRNSLLKLSDDQHVVLFTAHHIVCDGWSMGILVREVAALYEAFCNNRRSELPELAIQYADYSCWQREWLQGEVLNAQLAYWKRQLGGNLPTLELPTDRPRPAVQSYKGAHLSCLIAAEKSEAIKALSRQHGATLFMTLLAVFQVLLNRYTRQEDMLIGVANANRNRFETEGLIGFFINTLALRADLSGSPRFTDLLAKVRESVLGAYMNQDLPFDKLVEELQPERNLSHTPLVQVAFGVHNAPAHAAQLPGLKLTALEFDYEAIRFDLTLWVSEEPQGLRTLWTYSKDLFDESSIRRMQSHFEGLLQSIISKPDARITALEVLTDAEKQEQALESERWEQTNMARLMTIRRKSVNLFDETNVSGS
jgi:amino acid adenylation domain-containing protein/non-ribosomal peptide synthase protein (TIGR01720 family)